MSLSESNLEEQRKFDVFIEFLKERASISKKILLPHHALPNELWCQDYKMDEQYINFLKEEPNPNEPEVYPFVEELKRTLSGLVLFPDEEIISKCKEYKLNDSVLRYFIPLTEVIKEIDKINVRGNIYLHPANTIGIINAYLSSEMFFRIEMNYGLMTKKGGNKTTDYTFSFAKKGFPDIKKFRRIRNLLDPSTKKPRKLKVLPKAPKKSPPKSFRLNDKEKQFVLDVLYAKKNNIDVLEISYQLQTGDSNKLLACIITNEKVRQINSSLNRVDFFYEFFDLYNLIMPNELETLREFELKSTPNSPLERLRKQFPNKKYKFDFATQSVSSFKSHKEWFRNEIINARFHLK